MERRPSNELTAGIHGILSNSLLLPSLSRMPQRLPQSRPGAAALRHRQIPRGGGPGYIPGAWQAEALPSDTK